MFSPQSLYFSTTRYYVDEKSGFKVTISEEPGPDLLNIPLKSDQEPPTVLDSPSDHGDQQRGESVQSEDSRALVFSSEDPGLANPSTSVQLSDHQPGDATDDDASVDVVTGAEDLELSEVLSTSRDKRSWPFSESESFSRSESFGRESESENFSRAKGFGGGSLAERLWLRL